MRNQHPPLVHAGLHQLTDGGSVDDGAAVVVHARERALAFVLNLGCRVELPTGLAERVLAA